MRGSDYLLLNPSAYRWVDPEHGLLHERVETCANHRDLRHLVRADGICHQLQQHSDSRVVDCSWSARLRLTEWMQRGHGTA